jgi:hypothetical protein
LTHAARLNRVAFMRLYLLTTTLGTVQWRSVLSHMKNSVKLQVAEYF